MRTSRGILCLAIVALLMSAGVLSLERQHKYNAPRDASIATAEPLFSVAEASPFGRYDLSREGYVDGASLVGSSGKTTLRAPQTCREFLALAASLHATGIDLRHEWPIAGREQQAQMLCVVRLTTDLGLAASGPGNTIYVSGTFKANKSQVPFTMSLDAMRLPGPCKNCVNHRFALTTSKTPSTVPSWEASFADREVGDQAIRLLLDAVGAERRSQPSLKPTSSVLLASALASVKLPRKISASLFTDPGTGRNAYELVVADSPLICINAPPPNGGEFPCHVCLSLQSFEPSTYGMSDPGFGYEPLEVDVAKFSKQPAFGWWTPTTCHDAFAGRVASSTA